MFRTTVCISLLLTFVFLSRSLLAKLGGCVYTSLRSHGRYFSSSILAVASDGIPLLASRYFAESTSSLPDIVKANACVVSSSHDFLTVTCDPREPPSFFLNRLARDYHPVPESVLSIRNPSTSDAPRIRAWLPKLANEVNKSIVQQSNSRLHLPYLIGLTYLNTGTCDTVS